MSDQSLILSLDQGTTSSRAIIFNQAGEIYHIEQSEFKQYYPKEGWVEHDPEDIWNTTITTAQKAIAAVEPEKGRVVAIGITNQRETTLVWDKKTGKVIYNAIVWQDRRTSEICARLKEQGLEEEVRNRTGLLLDPYFSATKLAWILDNVEGARKKAEEGALAFGTVDSFLIWRLTGGLHHFTDVTNASRTSLLNIHNQEWDEDLLKFFNVPSACLPEVKDCAADYGQMDASLFGRPIPICGVAGDQQAAAIGQAGFSKGAIKSTYGTGCFVLVNTGQEALLSNNNLLTTIGYRLNGRTSYAIEGSIFVAGAAIQWLRDELKIITHAEETQEIAKGLKDNQGVYIVPAFAGLGAPHWRPDARAAIYGLTRGAGRDAIVRAALESVAYQTLDLIKAIIADGVDVKSLRVDGGMVANDWLLQFLSDILDLPVERPVIKETTALGVAYLAGLQIGIYKDLDDIAKRWQRETHYDPVMIETERNIYVEGWNKAVQRTLS